MERDNKSKLLVNALRTPDGTILESRHRHDYKSHLDSVTGETYVVDGGVDYKRGNYSTNGAVDLCVYTDSPHDKIRERFSWGSYGKCGKLPLHYILLKDMEVEHIQAILNTQFHISEEVIKVFKDELLWRRLK